MREYVTPPQCSGSQTRQPRRVHHGNVIQAVEAITMAAPMDAKQEKRVPEQSWYPFDDQKGAEEVRTVGSGKSVPELQPGTMFMNTKDQGTTNDAGIRDAVQVFLKSHVSQTELDETDHSSQLTRVRASEYPVVYVLNGSPLNPKGEQHADIRSEL